MMETGLLEGHCEFVRWASGLPVAMAASRALSMRRSAETRWSWVAASGRRQSL